MVSRTVATVVLIIEVFSAARVSALWSVGLMEPVLVLVARVQSGMTRKTKRRTAGRIRTMVKRVPRQSLFIAEDTKKPEYRRRILQSCPALSSRRARYHASPSEREGTGQN